MGTTGVGANPAPEYREVFDEYFAPRDGSGGQHLRGLALGSAGDISTELLWHLQNGMLPDTLRPRAWLILVGTNDLGRMHCSKRSALAGILNVAQFLHDRRPNTPILVHGLLPRSDQYNTGDYALGMRWQQILWINRELKKFCALHREWHYVDASGLFLERRAAGSAEVVINADLMEDSLHPTVRGYRVWAPRIVEKVRKVLDSNEKK